MIGASNLITAHTLARQIQCKTALDEKLEQTKTMFPLGAQVEIDYALECLFRHYYFVQDKTADRDGFVRKEDFDSMHRQLRKQLREAQEAPGTLSEIPTAPEPVPEPAPTAAEPAAASGDAPEAEPDTADEVDAAFPGSPQTAKFGQRYRPPTGYRARGPR